MAVKLEIFICLCPEIVWGYNDTCTLHFSSSVPLSVCLSFVWTFFTFNLLQNHQLKFNQPLHKAYKGEGFSGLFKWRATTFFNGRYSNSKIVKICWHTFIKTSSSRTTCPFRKGISSSWGIHVLMRVTLFQWRESDNTLTTLKKNSLEHLDGLLGTQMKDPKKGNSKLFQSRVTSFFKGEITDKTFIFFFISH